MWNVNDSVVFIEKIVRLSSREPKLPKTFFVVRDLATGKQLAPFPKGFAYPTYADAYRWVEAVREVSGDPIGGRKP